MSTRSDRSARPVAGSSTIIDKAFAILQSFEGNTRVLTLSELTATCGLPKSTVHRVLARLLARGAVERHGEGYKLGIDLVRLGATSPAGLLRDISLPYLTELRRWTGQRVELTVLRQVDAVCLERIDDTPHSIHDVGLRSPAHRSAAGRAILAFSPLTGHVEVLAAVSRDDVEPDTAEQRFLMALQTIRRNGIALGVDEIAIGMSQIAAPIIPTKEANAAVSIVHPTGHRLPSTTGKALRDVTARIGAELRAHLTGEQRQRWLPPEN